MQTASTPCQLSSIDEQAIHAAINGLIDAWHHGDADAFARAFTEDAIFFNVFAQRLDGRAAITRHHAELFAGIYRGSRVSDVEVSMRAAAPHVAVVAWSSVLHVAGEARPGHALTVFVRGGRRWQILSLHNMAPVPPVAASAP